MRRFRRLERTCCGVQQENLGHFRPRHRPDLTIMEEVELTFLVGLAFRSTMLTPLGLASKAPGAWNVPFPQRAPDAKLMVGAQLARAVSPRSMSGCQAGLFREWHASEV